MTVTVEVSKAVTRRSKGAITREQILRAALYVIARHGVKGTTHRAVAQQAGLQLSLTTYYFKDIRELMHDAFALRIEEALWHLNRYWQEVFSVIDTHTQTELRKRATKLNVCEYISQTATDYLMSRINHHGDGIIADTVLFTEARFCERLRPLALQYRQDMHAPLIRFCQIYDKTAPEMNAKILTTLFMQTESQQLSLLHEQRDPDKIRLLLKRVFGWTMGLPMGAC